MQFNKDEVGTLTLDDILEVRLRPLHNLNTREVFMLFNELTEESEVLTTLDIQSRLGERGISLRKKEINLSLHYLTRAGLIERLPQRGKPTIVDYDGRYSFDLWKMREEGKRIHRGLANMMQGSPAVLDLDEEKMFKELEEMPPEQTGKRLERLLRLGKIAVLLSCVLKSREEEVSSYRLEKSTGMPREEVEHLLDSVSDATPRLPRLVERRERRRTGTRLLRALGLARRRGESEVFYSLTESGRRCAERMISR
jgi:predicted transcriptional regulator